jgi:hypothetical protein
MQMDVQLDANAVLHPMIQNNYQDFFGGFQQLHLRIEGRENGDLGAVAP